MGRTDQPCRAPSSPGRGKAMHDLRNLWHGVLTPIRNRKNFWWSTAACSGGVKCSEEFHFSHPYEIRLPEVVR